MMTHLARQVILEALHHRTPVGLTVQLFMNDVAGIKARVCAISAPLRAIHVADHLLDSPIDVHCFSLPQVAPYDLHDSWLLSVLLLWNVENVPDVRNVLCVRRGRS
jgi:hypothetical protein